MILSLAQRGSGMKILLGRHLPVRTEAHKHGQNWLFSHFTHTCCTLACPEEALKESTG